MAHNSERNTAVELSIRERVTYEERGWKPIFTWWKKVYAERAGADLCVSTTDEFQRVFINGIEYFNH